MLIQSRVFIVNYAVNDGIFFLHGHSLIDGPYKSNGQTNTIILYVQMRNTHGKRPFPKFMVPVINCVVLAERSITKLRPTKAMFGLREKRERGREMIFYPLFD